MRVLITNLGILHRFGTESYVRDLAHGLKKRGHEAVIYGERLGEMADALRAEGLSVTDDLHSLPRPDIIHGHHHSVTMQALLHFRGVPAVFVCHSAFAWYDEAPVFPRILRYVAVDHNCFERLSKINSIPKERLRVILNAVDLDRFVPRGPLPQKPRRALVFSNYASEENYLKAVRQACENRGMELDVIGMGMKNICHEPEKHLGRYDLVFAKAKSALEAMAVGTAVILCDYSGVGGIVTAAEFERLRKFNFGRRVLTRPHTREVLEAEIDKYDPEEASRVSAHVRRHAGLSPMIEEWIGLYRQVISECGPLGENQGLREEEAALTYLRALTPFLMEIQELRSKNEIQEKEISFLKVNCKSELSELQGHFDRAVAGLQADIAALRNTRVMRVRDFLMRAPIVKAINNLIK